MELNFYNLPFGNLPYEDIQLCKQMMLRLYEKIPFLPELPLMNPEDNIFQRTLSNMPCITFKDGKLLLAESNNEQLMYSVMQFEKIYKSSGPYDIDMFASDAPFFNMYIEILKRLKPKYTVINLLGPFSLANLFFNKNAAPILLDNIYRKYLTFIISTKALWFIQKIKSASPDTTPIIMFDERLLYKFGTLKRTNENITKESVTALLTKVFARVRKESALVGVQSFEKCNWQIVFDTDNVDIISFDAYKNPANLNIIAPSVNKFLAKGGYINWGIIPVTNENVIRSLNVNTLQERLNSTIESLASEGVSLNLLKRHCTVSIQGDLSNLPIIFAEKAVMIANQLGKKISTKHEN